METEERSGTAEWKLLLARAKASLDEQGVEDYEKRKVSCRLKTERFLKLVKLDKMPYDFFLMQEAMVAFDQAKVLTDACRSVGVRMDFVKEALAYDADIKLVYDFIEANIDDRFAVRAREIAGEAQEGLHRMVTDDECKLNSRGIEYALKKGAKKVYGDETEGEARAGSRQVIYNLPNANINLLINAPSTAPQLEAGHREAAIEAEVLG